VVKGDALFQGDTLTGGSPDKHHWGMSRVMISFAPMEYFEFGFGPRMYAVYDQHANVTGQFGRYDTTNYDLAWFWLRDISVKLKGCYPSPVWGRARFSFAVGLEAFANIGMPTEISYTYCDTKVPHPESTLVAHGFTELVPFNTDFGGKFLTTLSLGPAQLHGNIGYLKAGSSKPGWILRTDTLEASSADSSYFLFPAAPGSAVREDQVLWGAGLEIAAGPYVTFLVEASGEKSKSNNSYLQGSPNRVTPGIRFNTPAGFTIDGGVELKMTSKSSSPNWNALFGFSVTSSVLPKPKPIPQATIAGKVTIAGTDSILMAAITITGQPPLVQKPDGSFSVNLPPGTYRLRIAAGDSFLWQEKAATLVDGQTVIMDFAVRRKEFPRGMVTGKITDAKTGNPVGATVTFFGPDKAVAGAPAISDLLTGIFTVSLPPNIYAVQCRAEGYNLESAPVPVNDKQTFIQNFVLRPIPKAGEKVVLKGIKFRTNRADIMAESYPILDEAAKYLKDNPTIKVEIGGHTDSRGGTNKNLRLSEARALSVRNYMINTHGIAADRLTAKGYGKALPIESNRTARGRAANRRIEFVVVSQQ
jgi:outer membrane protein OmpA-like peptidoglycan-associated protein